MVKKALSDSTDPLKRLWNTLSAPPYYGVPWLIFVYAFLSCLTYTDNGPFAGHIVGFDDQVRMTQVLQWVNGGGWYDRLITRVNAPEGFETIWARIVDLPIAAVIVIGQIFTDQRSAALAASVIVPMAELALMFMAARYFARPIAGRNEARLVVLFLMFTTVLNHKQYTLAGFHPGEASHHAWYGILNVLMFGAATRVAIGVSGWKPKVTLAIAMALLLAVGVEPFLTIAATAAILSILAWVARNRHMARRAYEAFGLGSFFSLLLLPMHVPPAHFFEPSFSQPSIVGPVVLAAAAAYFALQSLVQSKTQNRIVTAIAQIVAAGGVGLALICIFPEIKGGSLAGLSPSERILATNEHPEVWTMFHVAGSYLHYASLAMPTLIAVVTGIWGMATTRNTRRRTMYGAYAGFAFATGATAQVYWRYIHHAETAACPLLLNAWQKLRQRFQRNKHYSILSVLSFIAIGPFWLILLPAMIMNAPFLTQVVFFPAKIYTEPYTCETLGIADYLNRHYSPETRINVPDWDSADFLYESNLQVDFLSNYPSHDHFLDNRGFFLTQNVEDARKIAERHKFGLVAVCRHVPMSEGLAASRSKRQPIMIERLVEGIQPAWLKPVYTGIHTNYLLFEVDPTKVATPEGATK